MVESALGTSGTQAERGLLVDRATDHIRKMISSGRLGPGNRLNEVEIAAEMSISRGPVREAVQRFASAGLVTSEHNLGSRVVDIDALGVRALYEVRESLETMAARLAAERMTLEEKSALLSMLEEHSLVMLKDSSTDTYPAGSADWDFHLAILKGSGNAVAWRICGTDLRDMFSLLRARHGRVPGRGKAALQEHSQIAEAIFESDSDLAAILMTRHIRKSYRNLVTLMGSDLPREQRRKNK
jgi:DNA-binding GntR family transcriptional regulator